MLKRQNNLMAAFSMASMTDVIFLLLIFFMVTSTFVFPTGLEVNLPQGTEQSAIKPVTRVYIDANDSIFASTADEKPQPVTLSTLPVFLKMLSIGAENNLKMVLATQPVSNPRAHKSETTEGDATVAVTPTSPAADNVQ